MRSAELYAQVLARPADDAAVKVWADALLAEGDPRGEFTVLQLEHAAGRLDAAGRKRMEALQEEHSHAWLTGQVARLASGVEFERGRPVAVWLGTKTVPEPKLLSADWSGIRLIGFSDGDGLMDEAPQLVTELLALPLTGVRGVTPSLVPLLPAQLTELSIYGAALNDEVLEQLGQRLTRLRSLHVQLAQRPVLGHQISSSRLAAGLERLAVDFYTFEIVWSPKEASARVNLFLPDAPLLRIEAELRAGPRFTTLSGLPQLAALASR